MKTITAPAPPPASPRAIEGAARIFAAAGWTSEALRARAARRNRPQVERLAAAVKALEDAEAAP